MKQRMSRHSAANLVLTRRALDLEVFLQRGWKKLTPRVFRNPGGLSFASGSCNFPQLKPLERLSFSDVGCGCSDLLEHVLPIVHSCTNRLDAEAAVW